MFVSKNLMCESVVKSSQWFKKMLTLVVSKHIKFKSIAEASQWFEVLQ
jgi:hypothetical protein